jgi:hypothetical protein
MTLWMTLIGCSLFSSPSEPITFDTSIDPPVVTIRDACLADCNHRLGTAEGCPAETTEDFLVDCRDDCRDDADSIARECYYEAIAWWECTQTISWICPQGVEDPVSLDADLCAAQASAWGVCNGEVSESTDTGSNES